MEKSITRQLFDRPDQGVNDLRMFVIKNTKDPSQIANSLPKNIVNETDREQIQSQAKLSGNQKATIALLDLVIKGPAKGFVDLIDAYEDANQYDIVEKIRSKMAELELVSHEKKVEPRGMAELPKIKKGKKFYLRNCSRDSLPSYSSCEECDVPRSPTLPKQDSNDSVDSVFDSSGGSASLRGTLERQRSVCDTVIEQPRQARGVIEKEASESDYEGESVTKAGIDHAPASASYPNYQGSERKQRSTQANATDPVPFSDGDSGKSISLPVSIEEKILNRERGNERIQQREHDDGSSTKENAKESDGKCVRSTIPQPATSVGKAPNLSKRDSEVFEKEDVNPSSGIKLAVFIYGESLSSRDLSRDLEGVLCPAVEWKVLEIGLKDIDALMEFLLTRWQSLGGRLDQYKLLVYFEGLVGKKDKDLMLCAGRSLEATREGDTSLLSLMEFFSNVNGHKIICLNPKEKIGRQTFGSIPDYTLIALNLRGDVTDFREWLRNCLHTEPEDPIMDHLSMRGGCMVRPGSHFNG